MDILVAATIDPTDDGAALAFEAENDNGHYRITTVGDTVVISTAAPGERHRRVDRLTDATQSALKDGQWAYEGVSERLLSIVGVPYEKARVSFKATGEDGCPTCH